MKSQHSRVKCLEVKSKEMKLGKDLLKEDKLRPKVRLLTSPHHRGNVDSLPEQTTMFHGAFGVVLGQGNTKRGEECFVGLGDRLASIGECV